MPDHPQPPTDAGHGEDAGAAEEAPASADAARHGTPDAAGSAATDAASAASGLAVAAPVAAPPLDSDDEPDVADPEIERIPTPRRRRGPLPALAVLVLGVVLLVHLAPDLRYAISEGTPHELGPARAIRFGEGGPLRDNALVAVTGLPDYRNALLFEPKGDNYRRAFFRLLGTSGRLWVRAEQTSTRHDLSERLVGRLRRFDALPYADQVRGYYGKIEVTRLLDPAPFQRRSRGEPADDKQPAGAIPLGALTDRAGERVPLARPVEAKAVVVVDFPDDLLVSLSRERFAVEEDARHELERLGAPLGPAREEPAAFVYTARVVPAARDAFLEACEKRGFLTAVRRERYPTTLGELARSAAAPPAADGEGRAATLALALPGEARPPLLVEGGRLVPLPVGPSAPAVRLAWDQVDSIQVEAPVEIPHDAWVLIEGDLPSDYGWAKALAVVLLLFLGFNGWLLTRSLRGR